MNVYDIVIVGAGISGAVLAERFASMGKSVLIIEKRDHIAGNCFDYYNDDGILVSKYGAHLFHTNYEDVWEYVNRFTQWYFYEHRVLASIEGKLVPVPVNIATVNTLFNAAIRNEEHMKEWLKKTQIPFSHPVNGKEAALSRVGPVLYEKIFRNYTKKQWDKYPEELYPEVLNRIPVRTSFDDRYFTDKYQYLPAGGYTPLFAAMLDHPNITVLLNTDYFDIKDEVGEYEKLFYTGPIDRFFDYQGEKQRKLEYRSLRFEHETHDAEYYQCNAVINYPNEHLYTRIVEYKHMTRQKHAKTTIVKEYSTDVGEPYYPVPNSENQALFEEYQKAAMKLDNVHFVGRLANYKYFNMDQAFKNALDLFYQIITEEHGRTYAQRLLEDFEYAHIYRRLSIPHVSLYATQTPSSPTV